MYADIWETVDVVLSVPNKEQIQIFFNFISFLIDRWLKIKRNNHHLWNELYSNSLLKIWTIFYVQELVFIFKQQKSWPYHHLSSLQSFIFGSKVSPTVVLRIIQSQSWRCIKAVQIWCMATIIPPSTMVDLCTAIPVFVIVMTLCGKHHLIMDT